MSASLVWILASLLALNIKSDKEQFTNLSRLVNIFDVLFFTKLTRLVQIVKKYNTLSISYVGVCILNSTVCLFPNNNGIKFTA